MKKNYIQSINLSDINPQDLPSFIYNRYDLWDDNVDYIVLKVNNLFIEILFKNDIATIGSIMLPINKKDFTNISKYIFSIRKNIKKVFLNDSTCLIKPSISHSYGVVQLFSDGASTLDCSSSKHRTQYNKSKRLLETNYGNMRFVEFSNGEIPENVFNFYFKQKYIQMNAEYGLSNEQYISKFHVSNAYVLYFGDHMSYVAFSCEQTSIVFLENHTYDVDLKKHSIGTIGFMLYLDTIRRKGFKQLYLGHCDYSYKKRFSNHIQNVYSAVFCKDKLKMTAAFLKYYSAALRKKTQHYVRAIVTKIRSNER